MNTMARKLLLLLLALGFLTTQVWAYDDDDDEEEEEDVKKTSKEVSKPKKAAVKKTKSKEAEGGGLKIGFYGSLATSGTGNIGQIEQAATDEFFLLINAMPMGHVGALFNLGNDLELGLGFGFNRMSSTEKTSAPNYSREEENVITMWEIVPSAYYQLGKGDFVSYGAGLDLHLASWSITVKDDDDSETVKPDGVNIALFPNFQLKAEIVKDFQVWLKTGLMIVKPATQEDGEAIKYTSSGMIISAKTAIGVSFYL
jgi:hypothetical protein